MGTALGWVRVWMGSLRVLHGCGVGISILYEYMNDDKLKADYESFFSVTLYSQLALKASSHMILSLLRDLYVSVSYMYFNILAGFSSFIPL
jgi:hypothetical protein